MSLEYPGMRLPNLWRYAATAAVLAVSGTALFGALHAAIVVPIWRRLAGGLPFAFIAAAAMTWAHAELLRARCLRTGLQHGALFGVLLWLGVVPTTLAGALFRISGAHRTTGHAEFVVEILVAASTGLLCGAAVRSRRLAISLGVLVVALVLAMAGPIPVSNGKRPLLLFLGFLPIYLFAGIALSAARRFLDPGTPFRTSDASPGTADRLRDGDEQRGRRID